VPPSLPPDEPSLAIRDGYRENFDRFNEVLSQTKYDRFLRFFNFGYAPLEGEEPLGPRLGRNYPNRDSAQLLFQVVGDVDLTGTRVLEIGCGRGGNLGLLLEHHDVGAVTGTDIAFNSMAYCRSHYPPERATFFQADAQAVPVAAQSVDVVVNIESSGCYPDIESFYREVARVLRPGGWFLYADLLPSRMLPRFRTILDGVGLEVRFDRDITANVVASRAARAERQRLAFGDGKAPEGFGEWVGSDGSTLHDVLTGGGSAYQILRARRTDRPSQPGPFLTDEERADMASSAQDGVELLRIENGAAAH
jgi:phthiocerol/phenolphthiocerol synthesis type-I polyketide synthase E